MFPSRKPTLSLTTRTPVALGEYGFNHSLWKLSLTVHFLVIVRLKYPPIVARPIVTGGFMPLWHAPSREIFVNEIGPLYHTRRVKKG